MRASQLPERPDLGPNGRHVVIGVGNQWRHDDGAGLVVAREVRRRVPSPVEVVELDGEPSRVIEAWDGADTAVVVDAVAGPDDPGTILRLGSDASLPSGRGRGSHALGLGEAVELARALGRMPSRLFVYGIVGASFTPGEGLTPEVETACESLAAELIESLRPRVGGGC